MEVADKSDSDREDVWKMIDDDPLVVVNGVATASEVLKELPVISQERKS